MDWNTIINYLLTALTPIIVAALVLLVRQVIVWMRHHQNVLIHTLGELAYRQIENNVGSASGEQKMMMALDTVRKRLDSSGFIGKVSDEQIIKSIQDAWHLNEGQYKTTAPQQKDTP